MASEWVFQWRIRQGSKFKYDQTNQDRTWESMSEVEPSQWEGKWPSAGAISGSKLICNWNWCLTDITENRTEACIVTAICSGPIKQFPLIDLDNRPYSFIGSHQQCEHCRLLHQIADWHKLGDENDLPSLLAGQVAGHVHTVTVLMQCCTHASLCTGGMNTPNAHSNGHSFWRQYISPVAHSQHVSRCSFILASQHSQHALDWG